MSNGPRRAPISWKCVRVAGVAAVEEAMLRPEHRPARPERRAAVAEAAPGVVARRRADELDAAERLALPPLHLLDLRQRHAPALEVRADAERDEEARAARRQVAHGRPCRDGRSGRARRARRRSAAGRRARSAADGSASARSRTATRARRRPGRAAGAARRSRHTRWHGRSRRRAGRSAGGAAASAALSTASTGSGAGGTRTSSPENWRTM